MIPLLYIGISQSLFAALLVLTQKPLRPGNRILGLWLLLIALETTIILYYETYEFTMAAFNISIVLQSAYLPLMYIYLNSLIFDKSILKPKVTKHLTPFLIFLSLIIIFRSQPLFFDPDNIATPFIMLLSLSYWFYFLSSIILYTFLIFKILTKYQSDIEDRFSYISRQVTLNWLKFVLFLFVLGFLIGITSIFLIDIYEDMIDPRLSSRIALTVFTFVFSYFGIRQPSVNISQSTNLDDSELKVEKYKRSNLTDEIATEIEQKLKTYMETSQVYLNPKLSINDVSSELEIPRHYITQVLNERMKKNFFTWINDYRIRDVKSKLKDKNYSHLTILALAYECGFNSKSSFNSVFKKTTGQTPSQFMKIKT